MLEAVFGTADGAEGFVALIGLVGVAFGALLNSLANRKSTYVQTIAKERIKWVGELRNDLTEFLFYLEDFDHRWRYAKPMREPDDTVTALNKLKNLIRMKLNARSDLDAEILRLMDWAEYSMGGNDDEFLKHRIDLRDRIADLLKEEWEKAKLESSGLFTGVVLRLKKFQRYLHHRKRWRDNPIHEMTIADALRLSDIRTEVRKMAFLSEGSPIGADNGEG